MPGQTSMEPPCEKHRIGSLVDMGQSPPVEHNDVSALQPYILSAFFENNLWGRRPRLQANPLVGFLAHPSEYRTEVSEQVDRVPRSSTV